MPAISNNKNSPGARTVTELLFLGLIKALKKKGFVIDATAIAEFIALFNAFPDLEKLKFYLSPIVSKSGEEQELFYEIYDEWLNSQKVSDQITPSPQKIAKKDLHKNYILRVSAIVVAVLVLIIVYAVIRSHRQTHDVKPKKSDTTANVNIDPFLNRVNNTPAPRQNGRPAEKTAVLTGCPIRVTVVSMPDRDLDNRINAGKHVNPLPVAVLSGALTFIVFFIAYFFAVNKRKELLTKKEAVLSSGDYTAPLDIPFPCKESFIYEEPSLIKTYRRLKDKVENETYHLDIPKTINNTISNYGLFTPAFSQKAQDREYLIVIDGDGPFDQQIQLFNYLVKIFTRENIKLTCCYFYADTDQLYFHGSSSSLTWDHVAQLYSECVLIIISNGHRFLNSGLPLIEKNKETEFRKWENRVLVTPIPSLDWKSKEQTLSKTFHIIPADLEGWLLLLQVITGERRAADIRREHQVYSCSRVDFEDVQQLKKYLGDDDLFQWVCATAVYHRIRWEIVIEIGTKLLSHKDVLFKLNYSNLLKLFRIEWMKDGVFPTGTRISLLKELSVENELLARKAMLKMLNHSDLLLNKNSVAYKEKAIESYSNKFMLYANNPVEFKAFEDDADTFLSLWQNGHIADTAFEVYVKNDKQEWNTPVKSLTHAAGPVNLNNYITERNSIFRTYFSFDRLLQLLLCLLINFVLLHIIVYNFQKDLIVTGVNKRVAFITDAPAPPMVRISIQADSIFEAVLKQNTFNKKGPGPFKVIYERGDTTETETYDPFVIQRHPFISQNANVSPGRFCYDFSFPVTDFYKQHKKTGKIEIDILNQKFINQVPLNCDQYWVVFDQPDCQLDLSPSDSFKR
ncbi:hypothetical protein ACFGVR_06715 [Mucilaginibacter sp. AW1-3]